MNKFLNTLNNKYKLVILLALDSLLLILSIQVAYSLRLEEFYVPSENIRVNLELIHGISFLESFPDAYVPFILALIVGIPLFISAGLYKNITRYFSNSNAIDILKIVLAYSFIWATLVLSFRLEGFPRSIIFLNAIILFSLITSSRYLLSRLLLKSIYIKENLSNLNHKILIYGVTSESQNLANSISNLEGYKLFGFIDEDVNLQNRKIFGFPVISPEDTQDFVKSNGINEILILSSKSEKVSRNKALNDIDNLGVSIKTLPLISEFINGEISIQDALDFDLGDLLGRSPSLPNIELISHEIYNKTVLVTGAGGSIGSEICKQILRYKPKKIILFDVNEYSLYAIHKELNKTLEDISNSSNNKKVIKILPFLGSVQDFKKVLSLMKECKPDLVYHTAAYKHVPMVEYNLVEGIKNNVFGTLNTVLAAIHANVRSFVLISTDKAVRPTNIMGASKRIAEMILQSLSNTSEMKFDFLDNFAFENNRTRFSIVRFGNVLGSSGSVVPLFREQIKRGGPITLTDSEITRYFMSIPEAAQLVIQAGAYRNKDNTSNAHLYILDMGKPVKIIDLARRMISLSGLTLRDDKDPDGDIAIEITGLRPGEKRFEELLISGETMKTESPLIFRGLEKHPNINQMLSIIESLDNAIKINDIFTILDILKRSVEGAEISYSKNI